MKIIYSTILFVALVTLSTSCKKSAVGCSGIAFASELSTELNAVSNASVAYSQDPTTANCNAFKKAYQDYLNGLDNYRNCSFAGQEKAAFDQAIQEAQLEINQLVC